MSYGNAQDLGTERRKIIDKALRVLTENYPDSKSEKSTPDAIKKFIAIVNDFFLTDHVYDEEDHNNRTSQRIAAVSPVASEDNLTEVDNSIISPPVVQITNASSKSSTEVLTTEKGLGQNAAPSTPTKQAISSTSQMPKEQTSSNGLRRSEVVPRSFRKRRKAKKAPLHSSSRILYDDENLNARKRQSILDTPLGVFGTLFALIHFFMVIPPMKTTIDLDVALLVVFASVIFGMSMSSKDETEVFVVDHMSLHSNTGSSSARQRVNSETLMKKSMGLDSHAVDRKKAANRSIIQTTLSTIVGTADDFEEENKERVSLKKFPDGAEIGSLQNCWSEPVYSDFRVRGANYLKDKVKVSSGPFLFPLRGVEMFLSDVCPENIGRYHVLLSSKLRNKPTFLINYRLPWGNFVAYHEIPPKFLPFLKHCYQPESSTAPSMDGMSPAEVCACRYFLADENQKNQTLKIIPKVVKGPWIVKKAADGKPAIVTNKMPTSYHFQPASEGKAEYFEVDLDIVASSAARGILAVAQRYTKSLTLDLCFVLQGNTPDELPEQLVAGSRIHGLDPLTAPMLPHSVDGKFEF